jgi:ubiquinone/menaquinone biosynthesis C-methylase UbiE
MDKYCDLYKELIAKSKVISNNDGSQGLSNTLSLSQYERIYKIVDEHKGPVQVLDWGCGSGHFSYFLHKKKFKTHSFGFVEPEYISDLIAKHEIIFIKGDLSEPVKLNLQSNYYDVVFSIGVLEHVREFGGNEIGSLDEISRILKPNGLFICYHLPNKYSWIEFLARHINKYHHIYRYSSRQIEEIFSHRFNLLRVKRYGFLPRNFSRFLPSAITNSLWVIKIYNLINSILSTLLNPICQNYLIVAKNKKIS